MGSIKPYETAKGRHYVVQFRTKREAELFLASTEVRKATGEWIVATASRIKIDELGEAWLRAQTHLKPSSCARHRVAHSRSADLGRSPRPHP